MLPQPYQRYCFEVVLILFLITAEGDYCCHATGAVYCPSQCVCTWDNRVDCEALTLSSIPLELPRKTQVLNMANNKIRKLTNDSFEGVPLLRNLFLQHNHIQQLESGVFQSTTYLEKLSLQHNNLVSLHPELFHPLNSLSYLDLHKNALSFLHKDTFLFNRELRFLDLQGNRLADFVELPFHLLNEVTHLNLSNNPLESLPELTFNGLISLRELQLVNVSLRSVQTTLLKPLEALQTLNLTANNIQHLRPQAINFLSELRYLGLSDNPLKCDCSSIDFLEWVQNNPILDWEDCCSPTCKGPAFLRGYRIYDLFPQNLTCPMVAKPENTLYWTYWSSKSVVNPHPLPYDRMMGWYTASTLSTMLVLFLVGVALDKAKRRFFRWRRAKLLRKECMERRLNQQAQQVNKRRIFQTNSINSSSTCRSYPIQDSLNLATVSRQNSSLSPQNSFIHPPNSCISRQNSFQSRQNSSSMSRQNSFVSPPSSFTSRQNSNDGDTTIIVPHEFNRQNDISRPKKPLPKVKIHFAHNIHDFTNFTDPCEILKTQEAKIEKLESEMSETRVLLKWPSHTKLNELQEKVETTL